MKVDSPKFRKVVVGSFHLLPNVIYYQFAKFIIVSETNDFDFRLKTVLHIVHHVPTVNF